MQSDRDTAEVYRCGECGLTAGSIEWLHLHIDTKHVGFGPFNIFRIPFRSSKKRCRELTETAPAEPGTNVDLGEGPDAC